MAPELLITSTAIHSKAMAQGQRLARGGLGP